jgi:hypothetical protein
MPHNAAAIEMRKLDWDATREMPGAVSSRQKSGINASVLDVLLDEMLDVISGQKYGFCPQFQ